jgi:hypothetical protein
MRRLNIEISYNVYRLVQVFRTRESIGLTKLLWKAYAYLPMPHKRIPKSTRETRAIFGAVFTGMHTTRLSGPSHDDHTTRAGDNGTRTSKRQRIARADADRFLANALTCQNWRATLIEDIHAGEKPPQGLRPHQQRFTRSTQLALLREVTANFGGILYAMNMLFDEYYDFHGIAPWPETATTMANSVYSLASWEWSLVDTASVVELGKCR